jgi:PrcB C-terminal
VTAVLVAAALSLAPLQAPRIVKPEPQTVEAAQMSGIDRPAQRVVRIQPEWEVLWREHARAGRPAPPVDFSSRMVLAVFLGSRPTGGYSVAIIGTRLDGDTLVVEWTERAPNPRDITAQVLTSPAHLVEVPKHAGVIRFEQVSQP